MTHEKQYLVAVIGAGPAGLFGARELAQTGARVVVFNRDIKPGGLAEYGIYPAKHTMKEGLRNQFRNVLAHPNIDYFGNVTIGTQGDLTLDDLRALGFQAILVTVGAQGTKWLGLPGEDLIGVYHAKDVVYYYNKLPPFSQKQMHFGRRCAIVGAGNVMVDIARYLIHEVKAEEVIAVVRRGPAEVKFDRKEMEYIIANLDLEAFEQEIERIAPVMQAIGQNVAAAKADILEALQDADPKTSDTRFLFRFLASPVRLIGDSQGYVKQLEIENNNLVVKDGEVKARGTGQTERIDVDTVIFAIGDRVDPTFGLPVEGSEFVKRSDPRFPIDGMSYETPVEGVFVGGWSRQASHGLVGNARRDGINAARAAWQYLQTLPPAEPDLKRVSVRLYNLGKPIVTKGDVLRLEAIEAEEARKRGVQEFKFDTNEEMLKAIGLTLTV